MEEIGAPGGIGAPGDLGGCETEASETQVVVAKIAVGVSVGRAVALVEIGAQQYVDLQAVAHLDEPEVAWRNAGLAGEPCHDGNMVEPIHNLPVAGDQDPDVIMAAKRARKRPGDLTETAGLHEIRHLGRRIEDPSPEAPPLVWVGMEH